MLRVKVEVHDVCKVCGGERVGDSPFRLSRETDGKHYGLIINESCPQFRSESKGVSLLRGRTNLGRDVVRIAVDYIH